MKQGDFEIREFPELGEKYAYLKIQNGPELYVIPKDRSQSYAVLRVGLGGLDTAFAGSGRTRIPMGTAHFLEHKLFANKDGRDSLEILGQYGANANAYTTPTSTCYLFSCRERFSESLGELLRFVSEPYFTEKNVCAERSVIEQEIAMYQDLPSSVLYYTALRSMYRTHPLRNNICGTPESIASLTPRALYELHGAFYHPSRWQIFISGNVDLREVERIASSYSCETEMPSRRISHTDTRDPHRRRAIRRMNVHQPLLAIGIKFAPPSGDARSDAHTAIARDLLHAALFGKSGRLYQSLFEKGLLRAPFQVSSETVPGACCVIVTAETPDPDAVWEQVLQQIGQLRRFGLPREDFERMRRVAYADFLASLDSTEELAEGFCSSVADGLDLFSFGTMILETPYSLVGELLLRDYGENRMTQAVVVPLSDAKRRNTK